DSALRIRTVRMSEDCDEEAIRIARIDDDRGDLLAVVEAEVLPRFAGVGGFVDAVAGGEIGTLQTFAAANVDDVRIGRRNGDRADRAGRLIVEDRRPDAAVVGRLPDAAVVHADVEKARLSRHAGRGDGASAAKWSDAAPTHCGRRIGLREER